MRNMIIGALVITLLAAAQPACGQQLEVVVTFAILEDMVEVIGGDRVEVNALVGRGADPHTWEPTPREARLVAQADLLVANGGGFDDWLLSLVRNATSSGTPLVLASEGLSALAHSPAPDLSDHSHGGDPHFWLSVPNAIYYVQRITEALVDISPSDGAYFRERSQAYIEELTELDHWMQDELSKIPRENRVIVTYHNAFSYLAERYHFEVAEFLVHNPEAEPSPRDLASLVDLLRGQKRAALFIEPQLTSGARYMQALAREIQGEVYTLYSDSLSAEVPSYVKMMTYNTETLVEALQ
ncbi:MAG TPA: hypothetical protein DDW87_07535 [Firmicutes bacterium]|nr:hypothetical protein [Bacillota bacterium]